MIRICPKCNEEISSLNLIVRGFIEYNVDLDIQGDIQYTEREVEPDTKNDEYYCPKCNKVLFTSEAEAIAFLKGK